MQKDGVQRPVGADGISGLLCSIFSGSHMLFSSHMLYSASFRVASSIVTCAVKLKSQSMSLLLEDQGREASSEGHH